MVSVEFSWTFFLFCHFTPESLSFLLQHLCAFCFLFCHLELLTQRLAALASLVRTGQPVASASDHEVLFFCHA